MPTSFSISTPAPTIWAIRYVSSCAGSALVDTYPV